MTPDEALEKLKNNDTADKLRFELIRIQIESLKLSQEQMRQRLDARVDDVNKRNDDHERRMRIVEETSIKFNFILYLTMGGGLVSLINLALIVFSLFK